MHIKFLRGGGNASAAASYLTADKDSQGIERAGVTVLRGDPELVASVADGLDFTHTYTSGVLAWAPDDQPTAAQIETVLNEFEQTAWAGLEPDRYAWTAVQHDRAHRRGPRSHPGRPGRPGNRQKPQHRPAGLAAGVRPVTRLAKRPARLEPAGRPGPPARRAARPHGLPGRGRAAPGPSRSRGPAPDPDCVSDRGRRGRGDPRPGRDRAGVGGGRLNRPAPG